MALTLAKRPRYANGHAARCSFGAATRTHKRDRSRQLLGIFSRTIKRLIVRKQSIQ